MPAAIFLRWRSWRCTNARNCSSSPRPPRPSLSTFLTELAQARAAPPHLRRTSAGPRRTSWPPVDSGAVLAGSGVGRWAAAGTRSLFLFLFRDPIAFYFLSRDPIAFLFLSKVLCVKKIETGYQTTSEFSLFYSTWPTKHPKKSPLGLARVSLVECK
jgi:hypothetical protein